jgi:septal ring-binding cell division protein DamX
VSATEAAPAEAPEQRRCPRCGAALNAEQEWCLECGAAVGTVVASPSGWRGPVALVAVLLTIAAAALILALVELAGDPEQVSEQQPAAQTPPAATPPPTATVAPEATAAPTVDPSTGGTSVGTWPAGQTAWTVVLEAAGTEDAANTRAEELAAQGVSVGVLNSDDYGSLEPGRFVVFSGQYDSRRAANQALSDLESQVEGAYVRRVAPEPDASTEDSAATTP